MDYATLEQQSTKVASQELSGYLSVPIGKNEKDTVVQDLADLPHILICGSSGAGKTAFVQSIMAFLISNHDAAKVKFIIFDSKIGDYAAYKSIPQLLVPIISDSAKFVATQQWVITEIKRRFKLFSSAGVKDIRKYNELMQENGNILPDIFIITDDFSSLPQNTEMISSLQEILKNGRTAGIHTLLITSITSSKVLQRDIVSNVPCRISFYVASRADSRIAIQQNGAELLTYPGELIFKSQNALIKCQGIFYTDEQIASAVKKASQKSMKNISALGNMAAGIFDTPPSQSNSIENTRNLPSDEKLDGDEMLPVAVDVVLETGQASVSMLQRRLKLGYARAARIVDEMEEKGLVGPFQGSKPRAILVTKEQWAAIKNSDTATQSFESDSQRVSRSRTYSHDGDDAPDIPMRSFPQFHVGTNTLSISDNKIKLKYKINTRFGPGTATPEFNGKSIAVLIYKKPRLFSTGYIQFKPKSDVNIVNVNPHLLNVTKDNVAEYLKIEFGSAEARTMKLFMMQIAEDIGIPVTEL